MEQQLLFLVNRQWTNPALDLFMAAMSSFDVWLIPLVILGLCLLIFGGFKGRAFVVIAGLLIGVSDGLVSQSLKKIVQRPRPGDVLANVRQVDLKAATPRLLALFKKPRIRESHPKPGYEGGRSFPSSHTANNFCLAMTATAFYRARGAWVFLIAACVAYSRVYVGAHWPSDAIASAFLGCGVALLCLAICEALWRAFAPRLTPRLATAHPSLFGGATA